MSRKSRIEPYWGPVGGWGSARSVTEILLREHIPIKGPRRSCIRTSRADLRASVVRMRSLNDPKPLEFCENGAKATAWEITDRRCRPEFFARAHVSEFESWADYALEELGRLTTRCDGTRRPTSMCRSMGKTLSPKSETGS